MNAYDEQAEKWVRKVIEDLEHLLPKEGEDISCYGHRTMDPIIKLCIEIKTSMAQAAVAEG